MCARGIYVYLSSSSLYVYIIFNWLYIHLIRVCNKIALFRFFYIRKCLFSMRVGVCLYVEFYIPYVFNLISVCSYKWKKNKLFYIRLGFSNEHFGYNCFLLRNNVRNIWLQFLNRKEIKYKLCRFSISLCILFDFLYVCCGLWWIECFSVLCLFVCLVVFGIWLSAMWKWK